MVAAVAIDQDNRNLRFFHLLVKLVRIHTDYNDSIQIALLGQRQIAFICVRCRNQNMIAAQTRVILNAADGFALYKLERQNFLLLCKRRIFNVLEQQLNGFLTF